MLTGVIGTTPKIIAGTTCKASKVFIGSVAFFAGGNTNRVSNLDDLLCLVYVNKTVNDVFYHFCSCLLAAVK